MKIVIIGGVAAGMSAAAKAKRVDPSLEIVVYERTEEISFGACGLPYYVGGFFTDPKNMISRTKEQFASQGITVHTQHDVLSVDTQKQQLCVRNNRNEEQFVDRYDKLLIATGASPIVPSINNLNLNHIFTLKTLSDGEKIKQRALSEQTKNVVVIGAGFIGLEVVEAMKRMGKKVRLIERDSQVLFGSFDVEMTQSITSELRKQGVELHLNEQVEGFTGHSKVKSVETNQGSYPADLVIMATGVHPNTSFLKGTEIKKLPNGALIVDDRGRTSIKHVYAAGDCASVYHLVKQAPVYIPLATTANKLGRVVGENLAGMNRSFRGTLGSACIKVLELEAGRTGITERDAQQLRIPYKTVMIEDNNHTNYYPGQIKLEVKLIYHAETKEILGGQMLGKKDAVLRVDVIAAAIDSKMTTEQLGMLDLCYAPPFSRTWDILNNVGNVAK